MLLVVISITIMISIVTTNRATEPPSFSPHTIHLVEVTRAIEIEGSPANLSGVKKWFVDYLRL